MGNFKSRSSKQESVVEFSSVIKRLTNDLVHFMTTETGLFDALVSNDVLTSMQASLIEEKDTHSGRVRGINVG